MRSSGHRSDQHEQRLKEVTALGHQAAWAHICETPFFFGAAGPPAPVVGRLKAQTVQIAAVNALHSKDKA